jgi:chromosome segregation protein
MVDRRDVAEAGWRGMRLRRVILNRYGHLTDVEIAFPDQPNLHIVVGPNEAGKSTALSAIGDALFRFPHRTSFDFVHNTRDLRVGIELEARDGRRALFFRRKARKDDLLDADDKSVPEAAIAAFLGGATRERFDRVFGLNGAELRAGGKAILEGKGDAGSAILSAYAGVHDYRRLVEKLDNDARRLFGDKRGPRLFHEAVDRYNEARHDLSERRIDADDWKTTVAERDLLEQAQRDIAGRIAVLQGERTRLDRTRRTLPHCRRMHALVAERDGIVPVPDLPDDAAHEFGKAIAARDQAARELRRERDAAEKIDTDLAGLPIDDLVLTEASSIDGLAAGHQRIAGEIADRVSQRGRAAQQDQRLLEEGTQLGLTLDVAALVAKRPSTVDRARVDESLNSFGRLEGRQTTVINQLADAEAKLTELKARFDTLPDVAMPTDLRDTIDRIKSEGRLEADLAQAVRDLDAVRANRDEALATLPWWDRGADALVTLPVPLIAEIDRVGSLLERRRSDLNNAQSRFDRHDQELAELAAAAQADTATGDLPTEAAIHAARHRRDAAWALIRRAYLDGGSPITTDERDAGGLGANTATGFEMLVHDADSLADRRTQEQERVVAAEQRRRRQIEVRALRDREDTARGVAAKCLDEAEATWRALWQPSGLHPAEPPAMREWLRIRDTVLARREAVLAAERKSETLRDRHASALADLTAVLPSPIGSDIKTLAARLKTAEASCREQEARVRLRETTRKDLEAAVTEHRKARQAAAKVDADMTTWRANWATIAAVLALPPDASPNLGRLALGHWDRIDDAARDRREALTRVTEMTASIDQYVGQTELILARVAPDLIGQPPLDAVRAMSDRLVKARSVRDTRDRLTKQREEAATAIGEFTRQWEAAEQIIQTLRDRALASNEDELRGAIERWTRHADLSRQISDVEAALRQQDDGKTLAELALEAEGVEFDSIPARIDSIENELATIAEEQKANLERLLRIREELRAMEKGGDAAGSAQAMETALADIDDVVLRYPPLRMAQALLRAGIESFRRQQQGPLLLRAGQIFARLTEERYNRLEVDEDDEGGIYVVARQPDGTECRADRLSEGTLDQLYLALRLAAIEAEAATSEPLPFIGDDLLVNFDDDRARAALRVLSDFSKGMQVILFTHHNHIAEMAEVSEASIHRLSVALPNLTRPAQRSVMVAT